MKVDPRSFKGLARFLAPSAGGMVADRAVRESLISAEQLEECIVEQDRSGRPLDELLVERGYLKAEDLERLRAPAAPAEVVPWLSDRSRAMGHYVLVSVIGTGGMAEVWKAWDRSLGRWVAIKCLKSDIGHPMQRIEREGRMAGQLSHPSIITIFERGLHDGRPYLVMPFVDGRPPRAPLPPREAVRLVLEVARALAHAHEAGVIHRDVKPANILVETGGRVLLADFGLAIPDESATSRWAMSGTPEYASPEQIRGESLDARTDIYSLGATLHHLLSGSAPFTGAGVEEITEKILTLDPPPLRQVSRSLDRMVKRSMARDRTKRYPRVADLAKDLESWIERSRPGSGFRLGWIGVGVLSAVLSWAATFLILLHSQRQEDRERVLQALREGDHKLAAAEKRMADPFDDATRTGFEVRAAMSDFSIAWRTSGGKEVEAQYGLGRCYELLGEESQAEEAYQASGALPAARSALARLWGRLLLEGRTGRDWKALILGSADAPSSARLLAEGKWEALLSAGTANRNDDLLLLAQGAAAIELRRWNEAIPYLKAGLRNRPRDGILNYYLGIALAGKGDAAGAREAWTEAQRQLPKDARFLPEIRRRLTELEKK